VLLRIGHRASCHAFRRREGRRERNLSGDT
jgi:hypothetical protein